jgi:hypothetical protein
MLTPSCVRLSMLSNILREEYRRRSALSAGNSNPKDLAEADANIARANKLLSEHREYCTLCASYEREAALRNRVHKPVGSEREVVRLDRVS